MSNNVRVRFAPSPTGHLHLGGVRTALFNFLFARHHNGTYLLRVEDTDLERSKQEYVDSQLASLEWLGLSPDEDPVFQMSHASRHKKQIKTLLEKGNAYPCFCKPRDESEQIDYRKISDNRQFCDCRTAEWTDEQLEQPHAIRFRVPDDLTRVLFEDLIRGPIIFDRKQIDDFVICRRGGVPTYNFCVVADDIDMGITHVIRGEDHISNTPRQILLYKAFGIEKHPQFAHLPLILGPTGNRLSKRDAAVNVQEYRSGGFMANALFNYLARLGWSHGDQEIFSKDELIELFTLKAVNKKSAIFDLEKLTWLNGMYIRQASLEQIYDVLEQMDPGIGEKLHAAWTTDQLNALIPLYTQRSQTLRQLADFLVTLNEQPKLTDSAYESELVDLADGILRDVLQSLKVYDSSWESKELSVLIKQKSKDHGLKLVALAKPLRYALTGSVAGPGVFSLLEILGKDRSVGRVEVFCSKIEKN